LRAAEWRDRAEAALADLDELDLRDLRSVIGAAEGAARDDEARALATQLREGLARRVDEEQSSWLKEIASTLTEGRVVRALRLSSRPPKAGEPLPADLATRLVDAASAALASDTPADRWVTVLDALSFSPVHLRVEPASVPAEPGEALLTAVRASAARVPQIAARFGIDPSEAPAPRRTRGGQARGGRKGGDKPRPPKPERREQTPPAAQAARRGEGLTAEGPGTAGEAADPTPTDTAPTSEPSPAPEPATEAVPADEPSPAPLPDPGTPEAEPTPVPEPGDDTGSPAPATQAAAELAERQDERTDPAAAGLEDGPGATDQAGPPERADAGPAADDDPTAPPDAEPAAAAAQAEGAGEPSPALAEEGAQGTVSEGMPSDAQPVDPDEDPAPS
jgi:hypothetical protein